MISSISEAKAKTNQRTEICEFKIDNISDENLMPTNMFKALHPNMNITDLNKLTDKR